MSIIFQIGLILDVGPLHETSNVLPQLYHDVMGMNGGKMPPDSFEEYGNFKKMSSKFMASGSTQSFVLSNDKFRLIAEFTSGRKARCLLIFDQLNSRKQISSAMKTFKYEAKLIAYQDCQCHSVTCDNPFTKKAHNR